MITSRTVKLTLGLLACACACYNVPASGNPSTEFHVTVNTAALIGNGASPFSLDFQFNDGSGAGDGNNTVTIGNFTFGGGSAWGSANSFGNAAGNLTSGITLKDTTPFNEVFQNFTAGSTLGFDVTMTLNRDAGSTPDAFSVAILDNNLNNIPTTGVGDTLLLVNVGNTPTFETGTSINPAGVTAVVAVPEPSTLVPAALVLAAAWFCGRKRA